MHSRERRNDSNEMRRVLREMGLVLRETRRVSREGGNLHLSGTVGFNNVNHKVYFILGLHCNAIKNNLKTIQWIKSRNCDVIGD